MVIEAKDRPSWARSHQYGVLLITLLTIIGATAFVDEGTFMDLVISAAYLFMMASALYSFSRRRWLFVAGLALGIATQLTAAAGEVGGDDRWVHAALALRMLFMILATTAVFTDILRSRRVTMNVVFGACTVYLLLALSFGAIFALVEKNEPGSFDFKHAVAETAGTPIITLTDEATLTYHSMITLTTVGYGDITPISGAARTLSALEGLLGQLFIAVVLARMVAMELADRLNRAREPPGE